MSPPANKVGVEPVSRDQAFTLLELLVSTAVLAIILVAMLSLLNMTSASYTRTTGRLEAFDGARTAFETLTRTLGQATLLSRLGYDDPLYPQAWELRSDLHFISGSKGDIGLDDSTPARETHAVFFQAPLGVADPDFKSANALLNATGFFIAWGDDPSKPSILDDKVPDKKRFRLFQFIQPREQFDVYSHTLKTETESGEEVIVGNRDYEGVDWFKDDVESLAHSHVLAENIVALAILPMNGGQPAGDYLWNSRDRSSLETLNRLPDSLGVIMVAVDESSMVRLGNPSAAPDFLPPGIFADPSEFEDVSGEIEQHLGTQFPGLNYRIFRAEIPLDPSNTNVNFKP